MADMNKDQQIRELQMYSLFGDSRSGNRYKAAWVLRLTGRSFNWIETDVMSGRTRTADFLLKNPNGRVRLHPRGRGRWF